jgi:hypothetical protein
MLSWLLLLGYQFRRVASGYGTYIPKWLHIDIIRGRKRIRTNSFDCYHHWRTHLSLVMESPESRLVPLPALGNVVQFPVVGGLHQHYERLAA